MGKYTLIITEKPDAASRIAAALDIEGRGKRNVDRGVPYYQAYSDGNLVVVPALGHLYTVAAKKKPRGGFPIFDYEWVPRYLAEKGASRILVWLKVIAKLAENADCFVDACDYDIEGSLIGYCILKYACGGKEQNAKRMKYSTLTRDELRESYSHLLPTLDFALVQAGLARHEVDWLYGINLSRALTSAVKKNSGQYAVLSTGRVQGPTLKFLEEREKTIGCFVPTPYWMLIAKIIVGDFALDAEYEKFLERKLDAAQIIAECKIGKGEVESVVGEEFYVQPPFPFDLGALQSEAYRLFKYTPSRTSSIAQQLYLNALISYPRTSSQKLPPTIGYKDILGKLAKIQIYKKQASELLSKPSLKPNEGPRFDSAHPAIYPTGDLLGNPLENAERNVFDLIIRRFMAVFGEPAIRQSTKITVAVNGNKFHLGGVKTLKAGWIRLYEPFDQIKDVLLPSLSVGQKVTVKRVVVKTNFTKPPPRYNPRSLLLKMEKENIGTKATRAATIETLQDRKYVCGTGNFSISELGFEVVDALTKYSPAIVSPEMTKNLEKEMADIQEGKVTKESVLKNAVSILKPVMSKLKANESVIGQRLSGTLQQVRFDEKTVGACPKCVDGKLIILRSQKTGKRFVGCTNYFKENKCHATFPLPQKGALKRLNSPCKSCGSPMINVRFGSRHSWKLCLNPDCPDKKEAK
ncbi:MAG TPA: DNA topoisomerase I [Candidatus Bathyarchaeia archaeon]|nr:DNA topoisomerase I [Candidatus Bathyarchaeia archaeon]